MRTDETPPYILHEELTGKPRSPSSVEEDKRALDEYIAARAAIFEKDSVPLSMEMESFVDKARVYLVNYYSQFDIHDIPFPKHIFQVRNIEGSHGGKSELGIVLFTRRYTRGDIDSEDLNKFLNAGRLGHELYHGTARYKLYASEDDTITSERTGVAYNTDDAEFKAVEEGLARKHELEMLKISAQIFPEGNKIFSSILEAAKQVDPRKDASNILVTSFKEGKVTFLDSSYTTSLALVELLEECIPNFLRLVERARLEQETLALAREVERVFGRGSYRELFTASVERSEELLRKYSKK